MSNRLAGITDVGSAVHRPVLVHESGRINLPGGVVVNGALARDTGNTGDLDVLRAGTVLGKITASGKYAPSIYGQLAALHDTSVVTTAMTVPAAVAVEILRRKGATGTFKITGPPTAAGTVATETVTYSAINTSTGVITITATAADFAAGSYILPVDGSEVPLGLTPEGYGLRVTHPDSLADIDVTSNLIVGGVVKSNNIAHVSTDASVKSWLRTQLKAVGQWVFTEQFRS